MAVLQIKDKFVNLSDVIYVQPDIMTGVATYSTDAKAPFADVAEAFGITSFRYTSFNPSLNGFISFDNGIQYECVVYLLGVEGDEVEFTIVYDAFPAALGGRVCDLASRHKSDDLPFIYTDLVGAGGASVGAYPAPLETLKYDTTTSTANHATGAMPSLPADVLCQKFNAMMAAENAGVSIDLTALSALAVMPQITLNKICLSDYRAAAYWSNVHPWSVASSCNGIQIEPTAYTNVRAWRLNVTAGGTLNIRQLTASNSAYYADSAEIQKNGTTVVADFNDMALHLISVQEGDVVLVVFNFADTTRDFEVGFFFNLAGINETAGVPYPTNHTTIDDVRLNIMIATDADYIAAAVRTRFLACITQNIAEVLSDIANISGLSLTYNASTGIVSFAVNDVVGAEGNVKRYDFTTDVIGQRTTAQFAKGVSDGDAVVTIGTYDNVMLEEEVVSVSFKADLPATDGDVNGVQCMRWNVFGGSVANAYIMKYGSGYMLTADDNTYAQYLPPSSALLPSGNNIVVMSLVTSDNIAFARVVACEGQRWRVLSADRNSDGTTELKLLLLND